MRQLALVLVPVLLGLMLNKSIIHTYMHVVLYIYIVYT